MYVKITYNDVSYVKLCTNMGSINIDNVLTKRRKNGLYISAMKFPTCIDLRNLPLVQRSATTRPPHLLRHDENYYNIFICNDMVIQNPDKIQVRIHDGPITTASLFK